MIDEQQLVHLYRKYCSYAVNPPSYETWKDNFLTNNDLYTNKEIDKAKADAKALHASIKIE